MEVNTDELSRDTVNIAEIAAFTAAVHLLKDDRTGWQKTRLSVQGNDVYLAEDVDHDPFMICTIDAQCRITDLAPDTLPNGTEENAVQLSFAQGRTITVHFASTADLDRFSIVVRETMSHMGQVTDDEARCVERILERQDDTIRSGNYSRADLLRFLRHYELNVEETLVALRETVLWRSRFGVDRLTVAHVRKEYEAGYCWVLPPTVTDTAGRPIIVFQFSAFQPNKTTPLDAIKYVIYCLERAIRMLRPGVESVTLLCDCGSVGMSNFDERMERMGFEIMKRYYPGRLGRMIVVNTPASFRVIWKIMSFWLSEEFVRICHIFKNHPTQIPDLIAPQFIPVELGGGFVMDRVQWYMESCKDENVDPTRAIESSMDASLLSSLSSSDIAPKDISGAQRKGFMTKRGGIVRNWKKRYFVLKDACMAYYKDDNVTTAQGVIMLERSWVERTDDPVFFKICTPMRTYEIKCDNARECDEWVSAVQQNLKAIM